MDCANQKRQPKLKSKSPSKMYTFVHHFAHRATTVRYYEAEIRRRPLRAQLAGHAGIESSQSADHLSTVGHILKA